MAGEATTRATQVTIKYGKGYEETWVSFNGLLDEVREDIVNYFGLPSESVGGLTLSEVVVNATNLAHAKGNVAATLGGTVIVNSAPTSAPKPAQQANPAAPSSDPWIEAAAAPAQTEPEEKEILRLIKNCTDTDSLKRLWAENQAEFADPEVMDAWKAKGRALSAA